MEKKPIIGFVGMLMIVAGLCSALVIDTKFGVIVLMLGALVLAYALITGNVKFLG